MVSPTTADPVTPPLPLFPLLSIITRSSCASSGSSSEIASEPHMAVPVVADRTAKPPPPEASDVWANKLSAVRYPDPSLEIAPEMVLGAKYDAWYASESARDMVMAVVETEGES